MKDSKLTFRIIIPEIGTSTLYCMEKDKIYHDKAKDLGYPIIYGIDSPAIGYVHEAYYEMRSDDEQN